MAAGPDRLAAMAQRQRMWTVVVSYAPTDSRREAGAESSRRVDSVLRCGHTARTA